MDESQFLALPVEQRRAMQQQLQANGLYAGPIDGKSGEGMRAALASLRVERERAAQGERETQARRDAADLERRRIELEQSRLNQANSQQNAEVERRAQREAAVDPWSQTFMPFATGAAVGGGYGELTNRGLTAYEAGNVRALREIGDEIGPTSDLTNSQINRSRAAGAAAAAERFSPNKLSSRIGASAGRMASYFVPAGVVLNEWNNYRSRAVDPNLTEAERNANQKIANGLLGVATGIGMEGGRRALLPSRAPGYGEAMMRIETARDYAKRMDAKDAAATSAPENKLLRVANEVTEPAAAPAKALPAPEVETSPAQTPKSPTPGSYAHMRAQARELGIKGASGMAKADLADKISQALQEHGGRRTIGKKLLDAAESASGKVGMVAAPIVAGTIAYDAATSDAQAAGLSPDEAHARGIGTGLAAAGGTAGLVYGANKVAPYVKEAIGPASGTLIPGAGLVATPLAIADATDIPDDMLEKDRRMLARDLPSWMQNEAIRQAGERGQLDDALKSYQDARTYPQFTSVEGLRGQEQPYTHGGGNGSGRNSDDFDMQLADLKAMLASMPQMRAGVSDNAVVTPETSAGPVGIPGQRNRLLETALPY